jgi:hypothetical protein
MESELFDLRWWLLTSLPSTSTLLYFYRLSVVIAFFCFIFLSLAPAFYKRESRELFLSNRIFIISLVCFIWISRWPALLAPMMNVDEGQFIMGAIKLVKDPVFWQSVDTGSSGPLNIYPLILPSFLGLKIEYASARVVGWVFITSSLILTYYSLLELYSRKIARWALIPTVSAVALTTFPDYVNYISELFPIFILSLSLFLACKYYADKSSGKQYFLSFSIGSILGMAPYAKMQSLPIAIAIAMVFLHMCWSKFRGTKTFVKGSYYFFMGAISFTLIVTLFLTIFSLYKPFWNSYIQQNLLVYSATPVNGLHLFVSFITMLKDSILRESDQTFILFPIVFFVFVSGIPFLVGKYSRKSLAVNTRSNIFVFVYYASILFLSSCYSVAKPGNPFGHYLLFLIIPSSFLIGIFLGEVLKMSDLEIKKFRFSNALSISIILIFTSLIQISVSFRNENPYIVRREEFIRDYTSPVIKSILDRSSKGQNMVLWGWGSEFFIGSGLLQGTRDGVSLWQIERTDLQDYYLKRYLDDFSRSNPSIFIDTVGPGNFKYTDRATQGHEIFPLLDKVVQENFTLIKDVAGVRIYSRNR